MPDTDCAKRRAKPDRAGPRGSQNHAVARDIKQFSEVRVGLHGSLPQDFVATLELAEWLIVQIISIGKKNHRRILHRRLFDDAAGGRRLHPVRDAAPARPRTRVLRNQLSAASSTIAWLRLIFQERTV